MAFEGGVRTGLVFIFHTVTGTFSNLIPKSLSFLCYAFLFVFLSFSIKILDFLTLTLRCYELTHKPHASKFEMGRGSGTGAGFCLGRRPFWAC